MATFIIAYRKTGGAEGGYTNHPNDRGGETYCGIARKRNPQWDGWAIIDALKDRADFPACLEREPRLQDKKLSFYKENYWDKLSLDQANNQDIANEMYDTGVNCGTGVAATFLQRVLNVANQNGRYYDDLHVDGACGPVTIGALNAHPKPINVLKALNCLQGEKYISICEHNTSQEIFFNGWLTRVNEYCQP